MTRNAFLPRTALCLVMVAALAPLGCAARLTPPPIVTKAQLGKVVIYRNGVAYFERHAGPEEKELKLRVPSERVDDFLKSLSIVDDATGEALPVSYPTLKQDSGAVEMIIQLPERSAGLRITYVTESPAWKPSYRLMFQKGGKSRLQGWAVVDNVSGEDWKDVRVGVGSTSALSFRYDLHSVRLVERETLMSQDLLAVAPPTGGSPYAAPRDLREAAQAAANELAKLADEEYDAKKTGEKPGDDNDLDGQPGLGGMGREVTARRPVNPHSGTEHWHTGKSGGLKRPPVAATAPTIRPFDSGLPPPAPPGTFGTTAEKPNVTSPAAARARQLARTTAAMLRGNQRLRIEGYAQKGDAEPERLALERANKVRNRLIAEGVPADKVDAIGINQINTEAVKVAVAEDDSTKTPDAAGAAAAAAAQTAGDPLGQAHFVSSEAMTIAGDHSAMVSILQENADAERVYFYDPISARGSKDFAFNAVRLTNPSNYTLDSGPFTIYDGGQFLGEGLAEPLLPHSVAFIPYALDRNILVETEGGGREEIEKLVTAQRGIVTCQARRIRSTKLTLVNRGAEEATVYVRHKVVAGYELMGDAKYDKMGGAYLVPVKIAPGSSAELVLEEKTPMKKTIDLNGQAGVQEVRVFLQKGHPDDELAAGLSRIVAQHESLADLREHTEVLDDQMRVLRTRVDEINAQLVALKKLPQGERLRTHLSDRMQEISDKLQKATLERAELDGKLMTSRIELQDAVAELTLDRDKKDDGKPEDRAPTKIGAKP
jgi:hypothetical protein